MRGPEVEGKQHNFLEEAAILKIIETEHVNPASRTKFRARLFLSRSSVLPDIFRSAQTSRLVRNSSSDTPVPITLVFLFGWFWGLPVRRGAHHRPGPRGVRRLVNLQA